MKKTLTMVMLAAMLAAAVVFPAVTAFAEGGSVESSMGILSMLEGMLPESALTWVTFAVTICAAMAVAMPAPQDGGNAIYKWIYTAVQWIALNVGRAKNASNG